MEGQELETMNLVSFSQGWKGCELKNCFIWFWFGVFCFCFIKIFMSDGNGPVKKKMISVGRGGVLLEKEKIRRGYKSCPPTFERVSYEKGIRPTLCMAQG